MWQNIHLHNLHSFRNEKCSIFFTNFVEIKEFQILLIGFEETIALHCVFAKKFENFKFIFVFRQVKVHCEAAEVCV